MMIKADALIAKFEEAIADQYGYIYGKTHDWWTADKQRNYEKAYAGDSDRELSCKYGSQWVGHYVTDCSGLFAWAFSSLGGKMYHGSDTMYRSWCVSKGKLSSGKRTDGQALKPGTAVFVYKSSKGKYTHVGLYIGNGIVIEAEGAKRGTVKSKVTLSKWSNWGELKGIEYTASETQEQPSAPKDEETPTTSLPTLKRGMKGEYVTLLQTKLVNKGYSVGSCGIDGDFGSATLKAVKQFQKDNGLKVDGIVGRNTWAALESASVKLQYYSVIVSHLTESQAKSLAAMYDHAEIEKEVG